MADWIEDIKYYEIKNLYGTDGIFTVVCSDYLYEHITDASTAQNLMPWDKINIPFIYCINQTLPLGFFSSLEALGAKLNFHIYSVPPITTSYDNFLINDNKGVRIAIRNFDGFWPSSRFYDSSREYTQTNNYLPVGIITYRTTNINVWRTQILVCTEDLISYKLIQIAYTNGNVVFSILTNNIDYFSPSQYFSDIKPVVLPNPDPYTSGSGGHSGGGGGTGRFSRTGDTIGEHNVPTLSATDAGFITLFAPTAGEMKALASYLWSDLFSIDTFKKIFANPMDAILGLSIVPVSVPTSGSASVKVGNISTGVSMTKASTQYVKLSCGSLEVEEYWGAYLDYSPYTKCEIYLPYIGVHELSVDDVMGKTVKVVYYIDILSGACTAEIYSNNTCLYSFVGQCSASIPITGNDWTNVINGVMQIGASIGSMVASGGLTAPISAGGVAQGLKSVASASSTVTSSKPSVERSGSMSGAGGMLGQQTPYLIITWPRECIPSDQNKYIGYPSYVTVNLGEIVGFNIIDSIHLENIPATSAELDEIESLLMNGVIF